VRVTIADPIDRYIEERFPRERWGKSKSTDLARLRKDPVHHRVEEITVRDITGYFERRNSKGAGAVVASAYHGVDWFPGLTDV
jgi:hypothetical protein